MGVEKLAFDASTGRDYYTMLYRTALTISSSLELEQVLENIVEGATRAMEARGAVLRLLDQESGQLQIGAAYGLSTEYLKKGPVNIASSPLDSEMKDKQNCSSVVILDVRTDPRFQYQEAAVHEGLVSALCAPLKAHGESIGVIRVYTDKPVTFQDEDKKFLSVLASLAAQAIENARLYDAVKASYDGIVNAFLGVGA
ncbi:MAG TPA: GAF domain-containing protein [Ktedonobacteraceae bacterium]|jgi:GAF domain-containing protein